MSDLLLRDVEVVGARVDVVVSEGLVSRIDHGLTRPSGAGEIDGGGGALLPGLWDHHIHLLSLAAAQGSTPAGPPGVTTLTDLRAALQGAIGTGWVRAVGYHESVAGPLDRHVLDGLVVGRPVRVQHRSGSLWIVNSAGAEALALDHPDSRDHPWIERDRVGRATGRLFGADRWMRDRLPAAPPPDLAAVGRRLASYGVVGVTDATPYESIDDLVPLASATLPQQVVATGGPALAGTTFPDPLRAGPVKIVVADHALPALDDLVEAITAAHASRRPVAVHCVTTEALALALAAIDTAGGLEGDRIEHASVAPPGLREAIAERRLTVVTQPGFVRERGDAYLVDVEPADRPHLYPCRSLIDAGVPVAASTDAPFGDPDPWLAMRAAAERRTRSGEVIGSSEAVTRERALQLFLGGPADPGGAPRPVAVGAPADLCLLALPLREALENLDASNVAATIVGGAPVFTSGSVRTAGV